MAQRKEAEASLQKMTTNLVDKMMPILFAPISMQQSVSTADSQAKGPIWVSRNTLKKTDDGNDLKHTVIESLSDLSPKVSGDWAFSVEDVHVQWTSFKNDGKHTDLEPAISEQEKYNAMMEGITSDTVVLYAHGGFY